MQFCVDIMTSINRNKKVFLSPFSTCLNLNFFCSRAVVGTSTHLMAPLPSRNFALMQAVAHNSKICGILSEFIHNGGACTCTKRWCSLNLKTCRCSCCLGVVSSVLSRFCLAWNDPMIAVVSVSHAFFDLAKLTMCTTGAIYQTCSRGYKKNSQLYKSLVKSFNRVFNSWRP